MVPKPRKNLEDSITVDLDNIEEHISEDILKLIDEAVKRVIESYRTTEDEAVNIQNDKDIKFLATHPRESLKSFYKILKIAERTVSELGDDSKMFIYYLFGCYYLSSFSFSASYRLKDQL